MSSSIPPKCLSAVSVWKRPTGRGIADERLPGASRTAGILSSRRPWIKPIRQRRELAFRVNKPSPSR
jgi:hypothetical protein